MIRPAVIALISASLFGGTVNGESSHASAASLASVFFVSPTGSDTAEGSQADPFATIERARDAIRELKAEGDFSSGGVTVHLRGGVYALDHTLAFRAEDSGLPGAPVTYRAEPGETVQFVGGRIFALSQFAPVQNPSVQARLPESARNKVLFLDLKAVGITDYGEVPLFGHSMQFLGKATQWKRGRPAPELFFDDTPMTLARWPDDGFSQVKTVVEKGDIIRNWMDDTKAAGKAFNGSYVPPNKRNHPAHGFAFTGGGSHAARWASASDARLYGYWYYNWSDQSVEIASVDSSTGVIRTVQPSAYGIQPGQRFYIYNLLEELDAPGEWFLDRASGILYLIPPEDSNGDSRITLSLLDAPFVEITGASHLRLIGLDFTATRSRGILVRNGRDVRIDACRVSNTAMAGIEIQGGTDHAVVNSEIFNTGQGGIKASGGDLKLLTPARHLIENNHIYNYARIEKTYRPAISLSGVGQRAAHNEIHGGAHMAISFSGNNHLIELNHIYDVCRETDDMAAIYAGRSWTARGTIIRYNLLRDITGFEHGTHAVSGIYLDDGFSGTTIEGNIFLNVAQGLMFNGGRENTAKNNLFINVGNMMRGTDMREAFTTWATMSWTTLNADWRSTPVDKEPWRSVWPRLAALLDDEPDLPKYNHVQDNLRYRSPLVLGEKGIQDNFKKYGEIKNNLTTDRPPGHYDSVQRRFVFDANSRAFDQMPQLRTIPSDRIGRHP